MTVSGLDSYTDWRESGLVYEAGLRAVIVPPARDSVLRMIRMESLARADLVVRELLDHGWLGFESPMPDAFLQLASEAKGLIVDVGANSGLYTLLAGVANRSATILAFEPMPTVREVLLRNLSLNPCGHRVNVHSCALGEVKGRAELYLPDDSHGLLESSASLSFTFKSHHMGSIRVDVERLDDVIAASSTSEVGLLKIDVEGFEPSVLRGAEATIARWRPPIFVEVLPAGDPTSVDALREQHRYVDIRLRPSELVVGEPVTFDPLAWNHLLVPSEKLSETVGSLQFLAGRSAGLSVDIADEPVATAVLGPSPAG